jgi:hypothetical protein
MVLLHDLCRDPATQRPKTSMMFVPVPVFQAFPVHGKVFDGVFGAFPLPKDVNTIS